MVVKSRNTKVDSDSQFKFKMVCGVVLPRSNSNSSAEPDASTTGLNMHQKCCRWEDAQASGIIGEGCGSTNDHERGREEVLRAGNGVQECNRDGDKSIGPKQ